MLPYTFAGLCTTWLIHALLVSAQNNCYYGPGAGFRGPSNLIPCNTTGTSACCLAGDTCLSGNTCYNYATGNTYQYGCTDINYEDASCPKKCGWDPAKSPWIGLEYCKDIQDLANTWTCLAPESCGCEWNGSYALQILPSRGCGAMGSEARVALYAPSTLLPYVSLPSTVGGSTGYYSTTTDSDGAFSVIETAIVGYTPDVFTQFTRYREIDTIDYINQAATASPSTQSPAYIYTDSTPPAASVAPTSAPPVSSAPASTSSTIRTSTSSPPGLATPSHTTSPSGLSTNAKIGIGVGVAGGILFLAALGICCFLLVRRRKAKAAAQQPQQPPQYASPAMSPYLQGQQPSGWAPFPPNGMPYYVVPAPNMAQKDVHSVTSSSPAYSPPHSPPPPTELSTEHGRRPGEIPSPPPHMSGSPRLGSMTGSDVGAGRYA